MREPGVYQRRRKQYADAIGKDAVAVIHSPPERIRNGDAHYLFRQSSDLYYLSGFAEPEATLILRPGADSEQFVLFVRPSDPDREIWDGRRAGLEGAKEKYGADAAYPSSELGQRIPDLLANARELHYSLGIDPLFDRKICSTLAALRSRERRGMRAPSKVVDPRTVLHEMRLHKSEDELAILRKAADISAEAHVAAMKAARPGATEYQLEALINYTFRRHGGIGPGYTTIVGGGENATILHYIDNERDLRDGELVLIDAGCELDYYTADITRTFPVNGRFTPPQRQVYELVLHAQKQAVDAVRPGATLDEIHEQCVATLTEGMIELGLLEGPVSARIEDGSYKRYYMHRTSHWLGMDVHDVGAYTDSEREPRKLEPGMVVTIEPGLYIPSSNDTGPAELRGIGVRIEDDIAVTATGNENLSVATPKEIDDVEAACAE